MSFWMDLYRINRAVDIIERRNNKSINKNNKKIKEIEERKQQQKQQIERQKEYNKIKNLYESLDNLNRRIDRLYRMLDCYQYPTTYKDDKYDITKINPFDLEREFTSLIIESRRVNLEKENSVYYLKLINIRNRIEKIVNEAKEKQEFKNKTKNETINETKHETKHETRHETKHIPNNIKLFNKYANIIISKKFNDKDKMNMIKKIGSSGLDVESRKQLIELLNKLH